MCNSCGKQKCCCYKKVSSRGLSGKKGNPGKKGDSGIQGPPGPNPTATNLRAKNAFFGPNLPSGTPFVNDPELVLVAPVSGKYIVAYSGHILIQTNGDESAAFFTEIWKTGGSSSLCSTTRTFNYQSSGSLNERCPMNIFDTIDLLTGEEIYVKYLRYTETPPEINATAISSGTLNLIKIAD